MGRSATHNSDDFPKQDIQGLTERDLLQIVYDEGGVEEQVIVRESCDGEIEFQCQDAHANSHPSLQLEGLRGLQQVTSTVPNGPLDSLLRTVNEERSRS